MDKAINQKTNPSRKEGEHEETGVNMNRRVFLGTVSAIGGTVLLDVPARLWPARSLRVTPTATVC
jgi:hypothetical protein